MSINNKLKTGVIGATGFTGLDLVYILAKHPKIKITNLYPSKRPISSVADNLEVRNAKSITVKINNKINFNLLYDNSRSLQKKIKIEQLRKETS